MIFLVLLRYFLNFDQFLNVYSDLVIFLRPVYPVLTILAYILILFVLFTVGCVYLSEYV